MNYGTITTGYSMNYFLPTILNQLGWEAAEAQVHTIPVYLVGWAFLLSTAWISDHIKHRCAFVVFPSLVAATGYLMLLNQGSLSEQAKYGATFLIIFGGSEYLGPCDDTYSYHMRN